MKSIDNNVERREDLCTVDENINWCSHCGGQYEGSLSNSTSGIYLKKSKTLNKKRYVHPHDNCSIICNSQDIETI